VFRAIKVQVSQIVAPPWKAYATRTLRRNRSHCPMEVENGTVNILDVASEYKAMILTIDP
jgi:hypothetical protein